MQLFFSYIICTFLIYFILNTLNKSVRNAEVVLGTGWTGAHPPHPPQAAQVSVILTREGHNTKCHHSFITHCGGQCPGVGATTQSKETTASKDCTFHTNGKSALGHLANPSSPKGASAAKNVLTQGSHILCNLYKVFLYKYLIILHLS